MKLPFKKILLYLVIAVVVGFVLIQLVPYGRSHTNPSVVKEPNWDSPQTRQLAKAACFDCHSNETIWPWYSNVAPVSWLNQSDVDEARRKLNFSDWRAGVEVDDIAQLVRSGEMPPFYYSMMHPPARLSDSQKEDLIRGLTASAR